MADLEGSTNIASTPSSSDTNIDSTPRLTTFKTVQKYLHASSENFDEPQLIEELLNIIKETNEDINALCDGNTISHLLVEKHCERTVQFLVSKGARTDILNSKGETLMDLAGDNVDLLRMLVKSSPVTSVRYHSNKQIECIIDCNEQLRRLNINCMKSSPDFLSQSNFYSMLENADSLCVVVVESKSKYKIDEINDGNVKTGLSKYSKTLMLQCGSKVYIKIKGILRPITFNVADDDVIISEANITGRLCDKKQFCLKLVVQALLFERGRPTPKQDGIDVNGLWAGRTLIDHAVFHNDYLITHFLSSLKPCLTKVNEKKETTLNLAVDHADINTLSALLGVKIPISHRRDELETRKKQINDLMTSLEVVLDPEKQFSNRINSTSNETELWVVFNDVGKSVGFQLQTETEKLKPFPCIANCLNPSHADKSPLMIAVEKREISSVKLLIQCGADVNRCHEKTKQRAVDIAWEYDEWDFDMLILLIDADSEWPAEFNIGYLSKDKEDEKAFVDYVTERNTFHHSIESGNLEKMREFLSKHTTLSRFINTEGKPALETAIRTGDENVVRALVELQIPFSSRQEHFLPNPCQHTDVNGNTLLMISAELGRTNIIRYLLQCESDVKHCNNSRQRAIDLAWDNRKYDVVLKLLEADSDYPQEYHISKLAETETALIRFVEGRESLHDNIRQGKSRFIEEYVKKGMSKSYLNSEGNSALYTSVKNHQIDIYMSLKLDHGLIFKDSEELKAISELKTDEKERLNKILIPYFFESKNSHIYYLVSKSRSSKPIESFAGTIRSIYDKLNKIKKISSMLKVIPYIDSLDVIFDFDESSTLGTDAEGSDCESGNSKYNEGRVYIGAKVEEKELLGTLTHELAHLVMQMMFNNECNPYNTAENKKQFHKVVEGVRQQKIKDIILKKVFNYPECHIASELIVRVPHVLAKYGRMEGLHLLREQAPSLLDYYDNVVEPRYKSFMEERFLVKPLNTMKQLNTYLGAIHDIDKSNINFRTIINIEGFLEPGNHRNILRWNTKSTRLSVMNIYQGIRKRADTYHNRCIVLNVNRIEDLMTEIVFAFKSKTCSLIVLEYSTISDRKYLEQLFDVMADYLPEAPHKKLILISHDPTIKLFRDDDTLECELTHELSDVISRHEFSLRDFTDESQDVIVSREIVFQGNSLKLNQLIDESTIEVDAEHLTKLVDNETFSIGKAHSIINDDYIPRYFNKIGIENEVLRSHYAGTNVLVISGITVEDLQKRTPSSLKIRNWTNDNSVGPAIEPTTVFVIAEEKEENFKSFCEIYSTYNIHWLKNESGRLIWQKTHGVTSALWKFRIPDLNLIQDSEHDGHSEDSLLKLNNQILIISDIAGMGKTTVLTDIIQRYANIDNSVWIERIDLNEYVDIFKKYWNMCDVDTPEDGKFDDLTEYQKTITFEKLLQSQNVSYLEGGKWNDVNVGVKFLIQMLEGRDNVRGWNDRAGTIKKSEPAEECTFERSKLRTTFEKDLFMRCFHFTGKVILCFDGFDEISPDYKFIVNSLLKSLKETKVRTMLVTTRPHMRRDLEENFETMSYTFIPFTKDEQRRYIYKFWKNHPKLSGLHTKENLEKHATMLIELLANSIEDKERTFTGIPLQTKMLAEAFVDALNTTVPKFPVMLNISGLYEKFIETKFYDILANEKSKINLHDLAAKNTYDKQYKSFIDEHIHAALFTLFDNKEEIDVLLPDITKEHMNNFLEEIEKGKEKTGIIVALTLGGQPIFVHRTFAEYFAAEFFANCLSMKSSNSKSEDLAQLVLTNVLIRPQYEVVRSFLNDRMSKCSLSRPEHAESHEFYGNRIKDLWRDEQDELWTKHDRYTAFHISAIENNCRIVNFLVACLGHCKEIREVILNQQVAISAQTALHMATQNARKEMVQSLVEAGADINMIDGNYYTPLHIAAIVGSHSNVQYLLSRPNIVVFNDSQQISMNNPGWTPLHLAVLYNHSDVVRLLVATGPGVLEIRDRYGDRPLEMALHMNRPTHYEIMRLLKPDDYINYMIRSAVNRGDLKSVENYLTSNDVDMNWFFDGETHLHKAVRRGHVDVARFLIEKGADVKHRNARGNTSVFVAAGENYIELLKLFAEKDPELFHVESDTGWHILHMACRYGHLEIVRYLIEDVKQDVNLVDDIGGTALHTAAFHNRIEVVKYLLEVVKVDRNPINKFGMSVTMVSAFHINHDITKYLLNGEDASMDVQRSEKNLVKDLQLTTLHMAAASGDLRIVEFLVEKGFQVDAGSCFTPLHVAALFDRSEVARYLIAHGARIDAESDSMKVIMSLSHALSNIKLDLHLGSLEYKHYINAIYKIAFALCEFFSNGSILSIPNFTPQIMYECLGYTECSALSIIYSDGQSCDDRIIVLKMLLDKFDVRQHLDDLRMHMIDRKSGARFESI